MRRLTASWRVLPAGMFDAGLSSLATLAVGVYAAHSLTRAEFGAYALFNSAFLLAAVVPTHLVLSPAAFATVPVARSVSERLALVDQTWRLGLAPAGVTAVAASAAACLSAGGSGKVLWPLAVTSGVCSVVSPLQDHVRRTLHMGGRSWAAALVSLIQLAGVAGALAVLHMGEVQAIWRPFSALAVANTLSLAAGVAAARGERSASLPRFDFATMTRAGRWLLSHHVAMAGGFFASTAVVTRLAGAEAVGQAEAARLAAQPLFVLSSALQAVTWPRSMEAATSKDLRSAQQVARPFVAVMATAGVLYGAVTFAPWAGNPLARLLPEAYTVKGLVLVSVIAHVLLGCFNPHANELLGAGRQRVLALVGVRAGVLQCAAATTAIWIGAFARPVGLAVFSAAVLAGYQPHRRRIYRRDPASPSAEPERLRREDTGRMIGVRSARK